MQDWFFVQSAKYGNYYIEVDINDYGVYNIWIGMLHPNGYVGHQTDELTTSNKSSARRKYNKFIQDAETDFYGWNYKVPDLSWKFDINTELNSVQEYILSNPKNIKSSSYIRKGSNMKKYVKAITSDTNVNCTTELDDRFNFDFDEIGNEVYIDARVEYAPIYLEDEQIIGNGEGMQYGIIIAIPRDKDHWQMKERILRSLDEHVQSAVDGSDYYGDVVTVDSHTHPHYANIPDDVYDDSVFYSATIEIVPYDNIGPDSDYGIDFGVEDDIESSTSIDKIINLPDDIVIRVDEVLDYARNYMQPEDIDHHGNGKGMDDLYLRVNDVSKWIVNHMDNTSMVSKFIDNIDHVWWYELPFLYHD